VRYVVRVSVLWIKRIDTIKIRATVENKELRSVEYRVQEGPEVRTGPITY